jgi:ABC-type multidrug transport system fused ATPase/permease subunit
MAFNVITFVLNFIKIRPVVIELQRVDRLTRSALYAFILCTSCKYSIIIIIIIIMLLILSLAGRNKYRKTIMELNKERKKEWKTWGEKNGIKERKNTTQKEEETKRIKIRTIIIAVLQLVTVIMVLLRLLLWLSYLSTFILCDISHSDCHISGHP